MILARAAKGGMRDAESMLEQLAAYGNGTISIRSISEIFSFIPPQETEELMGYILTGSLKEALTHLEKSHEKGQDAENILYDLAALANNLLLQETSVELEKPISPHQLANLTQTLSEVKVSMHGKTNKYPYVLTGVLQGIRDIHEASTEEVIKALQQQE
jgi:DNA polymerase III gamma/tau subunit